MSGPSAVLPARPARRRSLSFPIGRVAGIQLRVHVTFFLLVALFAVAGTAPGGPGAPASVLWLLVIFGCVVLHELAHCLVARPRGAVVHEIELLPIGGVSKMEQLPEKPGDELAIAIAGPAASAGIAAVAALAAVALAVPLLPIDLFGGPFLARLAWFNLLLAGFNLLPAFPLDGGRVFRSLLERRLDLEQATRIAARVGRRVAIVFGVVGLFWNLWLVIIAIFVYMGASAEEAATIVHVRTLHLRVGDVMLLDPVLVEPGATFDELHALLRRSAQRVFPVSGGGGYEGVLDAGRIARGSPGSTAAELAERDAPTLAATDGLEACLPAVTSAPARALAVVDGPRVVGILRVEEIKHLLEQTTEA